MKNNKIYYLIFMFAVLIVHTLLLNNWLSHDTSVKNLPAYNSTNSIDNPFGSQAELYSPKTNKN